MKEDLAGGKLLSGDFGENAAWWGITALAFNLNVAMQRLVRAPLDQCALKRPEEGERGCWWPETAQ